MKIGIILLSALVLASCLTFDDIEGIKYMSEEEIRCGGSSKEWKTKEYELPDVFQVGGTASGYLPVENLTIQLTVESKQDSAADTLKINNNKIAHLIYGLIKMGLKQSNIKTSELEIYPTYHKVFDVETQDYKKDIEWIVVKNKVSIQTNKIDLAGKIIDLVISRSIDQVDSVSFSPSSENIKKLKEQLIVEAVEDAKRRALLALDPINYEIVSVKNVEIESQRQPLSRRYSELKSTGFGGAQDEGTQVFASNQNFQTEVNVSFIIKSKTEKFTLKH